MARAALRSRGSASRWRSCATWHCRSEREPGDGPVGRACLAGLARPMPRWRRAWGQSTCRRRSTPSSSSRGCSAARPRILYIKRAARIGDNWSAHVAFPGGRKEEGDENGLYTAMRETWEEVGIDLAEKEFACVGQLDDREITRVWVSVCSWFSRRTSSCRPRRSARCRLAAQRGGFGTLDPDLAAVYAQAQVGHHLGGHQQQARAQVAARALGAPRPRRQDGLQVHPAS